jgi:shikimate kinase
MNNSGHDKSGAPSSARPQILALIGLRGSGKTTLGRALAARLGLGFVDLDDELWKHAASAADAAPTPCTAGELLRRSGESVLRDAEAAALAAVLERNDRFVLATGGGSIERAANKALLSTRCRCAWLDAPSEVLVERLAASAVERPALTDLDARAEIERLRARREHSYAELAEQRFTSNQPLATLVGQAEAWARAVVTDPHDLGA